MPDNQTKGDMHNVSCPHCGKNNPYASQGVPIPHDSVKRFSKPCWHCAKTIFFHGSWEIVLLAFTEDPIEKLRAMTSSVSETVEVKTSEEGKCPNCFEPGYDGSSCYVCGHSPRIG